MKVIGDVMRGRGGSGPSAPLLAAGLPAAGDSGRPRRLWLSIVGAALLAVWFGVAGILPAGTVTILKSFTDTPNLGYGPMTPLISDGAGHLYGTTILGGASDGTVFRVNADGADFVVLHSFSGGESDGSTPFGRLVLDGETLFGTTYRGGAANRGTVFKVRTDGSGFEILYSFAGGNNDGCNPHGGLVLGPRGILYGATMGCGWAGFGTIFKISTDGSAYGVLAILASFSPQIRLPLAGLVLDGNGVLYGTAARGGANDDGAIFRIRTDGGGQAVLHSFQNTEGYKPWSRLVLDDAGGLYGTTELGGKLGGGSVFRISTGGTGFVVLYNFPQQGPDPPGPYYGPTESGPFHPSLVLDGAGNLYGTSSASDGTNSGRVFSVKADGTGFAVLHQFTGGASDGRWPYAALILDGTGHLYGTTYAGGTSEAGTVFSLGTDGSGFTVRHSFNAAPPDGANPHAGLALDTDGTLYGTTEYGGIWGAGTVFKLATDGTGFSMFHTFADGTSDGANPVGPFTARPGTTSFYGTTAGGGANGAGTVVSFERSDDGVGIRYDFAGSDGSGPEGRLIVDSTGKVFGTTPNGGDADAGTVFKLGNGNLTVLHSFAGGAAGAHPYGGLVRDWSGNLYGTTAGGGVSGNGTVFTVWPDKTFVVLHHFAGDATDGANPYGDLTLVGDDTLIGTTTAGGTSNLGTVFTIKTDGSGFEILHSFGGAPSDGAGPHGDVLLVGTDTLVGTTVAGGASDNGAIFTVKTDGSGFYLVHSFGGAPADGAKPYGGLVADAAGHLYGTTANGGEADRGTVYTLSTPAPAPVPPVFTSAPAVTFVIGHSDTFAVTATGYPVPTLAKSGFLPSGVGFADNGDGTATLSGTPAEGTSGTYPLVFTAHNGVGADAVQTFTLTVSIIAIDTTSPLGPAVVGTPYAMAFHATGGSGTYTWSVVSGAVPGGLTLSSNGTLIGTPAAIGDFSFTVRVDDGAGQAAQGVFALHVDPAYSHSLWVPVASHTAGLNNSLWRSDLTLLNTGSAAARVKLVFHGASGTASSTLVVAGGAQSILVDVVGQIGGSGSGAIEILSDEPVKATIRPYNLESTAAPCYPGGSQGQGFPVLRPAGGLAEGQSTYLTGLVEDAAYRSNIGLFAVGDTNPTVLVELFNASGSKLGEYALTLERFRWAQETQPFKTKAGQTNIESGYAKISVLRGSGVFAFASVIDNLTNDPTTVTPSDAPRVTVGEFSARISGGRQPKGITAGPDGAVWFTLAYGDLRIGRVTESGAVTVYATGNGGTARPLSITSGPDGALWFTERSGRIGRITTQGELTEFGGGLLDGGSISPGSDGALWFTVVSSGRIGRITTAGVVTGYSTELRGPASDLALGPDGALWFTEPSAGRVGRITTSEEVTEYAAGITGRPVGIAAGADGALWFTEPAEDRIGRITTSGEVTEYSAGITPGARPTGITAGPDGALWFSEAALDRIGRIATTGVVAEYSTGTGAGSSHITAGSDGALWFTETSDNIARFPVAPSASADTFSLWVPVAAHNPGLTHSQWRTDLGLLNTRQDAASAQIKFFGSDGVITGTVELPPGEQSLLADVVGELGGTGSGAIEIISDRPLVVTSRTYNLVSSSAECYANGTQGQGLPALVDGNGLSTGQSAFLAGLRENAAYRSNLGIVNLGSSSATVLVELFDGTGKRLADYSVALAAGEWAQETQPFRYRAGQSALESGYARITVQTGSGVVAFASLIDNITNDATTVAMQR